MASILQEFSRNQESGFQLIVLLFLVLNFAVVFKSEAQVLPPDEIQTLQQIASKLGIRRWNVRSDSCVTGGLNASFSKEAFSKVACDCTFNSSTICRIITIELNTLNLTGELPDEFANLNYLRRLNLTLNYLNGSIPRRWTTLPLTFLGLQGNLVGGTIPSEIGSMATLEELVLQDNEIGGPLPREMGDLINLTRLLLSGNNFTGVLPDTFGALRNLTDFRIDGSDLSGRIPEYIGNWAELSRLYLQGTSMQGPIPSSIFHLTKLKYLRISDLNVSNMPFPNLTNLPMLEDLVLRNCSIIGQIPSVLAERVQKLKRL